MVRVHQQRERHTVLLDLVALERRGEDGYFGQRGTWLEAEATCLARRAMTAARPGDLPARRYFASRLRRGGALAEEATPSQA